jgi:hypothetical protein
VSAFEGIEVATTLGGQRRGARVRPKLKAIKSGVVRMRDGTTHTIQADLDYWDRSMLARMLPEYAHMFTAVDMTAEMRNARRARRSRRSTRRPRERWRLP